MEVIQLLMVPQVGQEVEEVVIYKLEVLVIHHLLVHHREMQDMLFQEQVVIKMVQVVVEEVQPQLVVNQMLQVVDQVSMVMVEQEEQVLQLL